MFQDWKRIGFFTIRPCLVITGRDSLGPWDISSLGSWGPRFLDPWGPKVLSLCTLDFGALNPLIPGVVFSCVSFSGLLGLGISVSKSALASDFSLTPHSRYGFITVSARYISLRFHSGLHASDPKHTFLSPLATRNSWSSGRVMYEECLRGPAF